MRLRDEVDVVEVNDGLDAVASAVDRKAEGLGQPDALCGNVERDDLPRRRREQVDIRENFVGNPIREHDLESIVRRGDHDAPREFDRSDRFVEFPEVDRGGWFDVDTARVKLNAAQVVFLDRLRQVATG